MGTEGRDLEERYRAHLAALERAVDRALAQSADGGARFGGVVFHSGSSRCYHADDREIPFRPTPHFARFAPLPGPDHLLVVRPGTTPRLALCVPRDYWTQSPEPPAHPFANRLDVVEVESLEDGITAIGDVRDCAYVGDAPDVAARLGVPEAGIEPGALLVSLDWDRAIKTDYEIGCIREAARVAASGHVAARAGFERGASEREIHADYLAATGHLENETPYPNIIAWDDRSAVLHYPHKRRTPPHPGHTFLIDAGAEHAGYACDITRSYAKPAAHGAFRAALVAMEALQRRLVACVVPGRPYVELHDEAVRGVCEILCDLDILTVSAAEAYARRLAAPFLPHGLGHHLGLQVHDVGGQLADRRGKSQPPPAQHPRLRTTRVLAPGHVVTVEPGLYFIPMLLDPLRGGDDRGSFDWSLVDELIPCGGIRIEDDVLVTPEGGEDLTRPFVPGWQIG